MRTSARLLLAGASATARGCVGASATARGCSAAAAVECLTATERSTLAEARALRSVWQLLRDETQLEPACSSCDCGEPCDDPLSTWAGCSAPERSAVRAAATAHAALFSLAPPPRDASDSWAELPFATAAALLLRAANVYHPGRRPLSFADLGSGVGRPALAASLLPNARYATVLGWEVDATLHSHAAAAAAAATAATPGSTRLVLGDAGTGEAVEAWRAADVVLAHGSLSAHLADAAVHLGPGALLVTAGGQPVESGSAAARAFQLCERRRLPISWGMGTLFLHRRLASEDGAGGWAGGDESDGARILRESGVLQARVLPSLLGGGASATEAACVIAFAARGELSARALCVGQEPALRALADALIRPGTLHARAAAALALSQLCQHSASLWPELCSAALPALVSSCSATEASLRSAAASALADLAQAGEAAGALRRAGAEGPLRRLAAEEDGGAAAAAAATALEAMSDE